MPDPMSDSTPATAADRYLHGAYHPNGHCPNGVCAEPTTTAAPLRCPRCTWMVAISEVDPPASADDFLQHLRWLHGMSHDEALEALARA